MTEHICFLISEYYPYASSNTVVIEPFIQEFNKRGLRVDVITRRQNNKLLNYEKINGVNVYRVDDLLSMQIMQINEETESSAFTWLRNKTNKIMTYLKYRGKKGEIRYGGWSEKAIIRKLEELNAEMPITRLISISYPFKTHEIAQIFKSSHPDIWWAFFQFDPYTYNTSEYGFGTAVRKKKELSLMNSADRIYVTRELGKYYSKTEFKKLISKMFPFIFPNFHPINCDKSKSILEHNGALNIVYAGALSKKIRSPQYLLKCFKECDFNFILNIITGNKLNYVKKYIIALGQKIKIIERQTIDTARACIADADAVVSIGNNVEFQTPGKIIEYMSLGVPIIHLSKIKNDPALFYLNGYPFLCIIKEYENSILESAQMIKDFINKYAGRSLTYDETLEAVSNLEPSKITSEFANDLLGMIR